ncbi:unnamed protein product [Rotaria sp. Silwood1]|nr:unnamed protein product [Rotaria sp. Silwood1]
MKSSINSRRKWIGFIWLFIEVNLISANIFGFPALFKILPNYGVYSNYCQSSNLTNSTEQDCSRQSQQYQNALTLGIIFFNLPSIIVGILIDKFGGRFVKLIGIVFHVVGWLALALVKSDKYLQKKKKSLVLLISFIFLIILDRDSLLFIHTLFTALSGIIVQLTSFSACNYFAEGRAFLLTLLVGSSLSASMWYSVFQILIDNGKLTLSQLSYIWMSFGIFMLFSSFEFLDWKFQILNLGYTFDTKLEQTKTIITENTKIETKWYGKIRQRIGIWEHLTNPLYIFVVLYLSFLLMPSILLSVTWYPWVYYINHNDKTKSDQYTFAFNMTSLSQIFLCPLVGFLLTFRADKSSKQKILNTSIAQTCSWILNIILCIICMFVKTTVVVPALVFNYIGRSAIVAGSQAVVGTFFPSEYIGRLTGIMWTSAGAITCIQYGLVQLTTDVSQSWKAGIIVLILVVFMSCHLVQIWYITIRKYRKPIPDVTYF